MMKNLGDERQAGLESPALCPFIRRDRVMIMKMMRAFSILFLALGIMTAAINPDVSAAPARQDGAIAPTSSIAPPHIIPNKESFTVREGDSLVVVVNSTCPSQDEGSAGFEFLSSTPEFVRISSVYRRADKDKDYVAGLAVIHITPQIGDAGKYDIGVMVRACNGMVERLISFQVKVKRAAHNQ